MKSVKEYGIDRIQDTSYEFDRLDGEIVLIGKESLIKDEYSPNGYPGYTFRGTGCSGTGCVFMTQVTGYQMRNVYVEHKEKDHDTKYDPITGRLLKPVYLYAENPDYITPPNPSTTHGNKGKRRAKKLEEEQ